MDGLIKPDDVLVLLGSFAGLAAVVTGAVGALKGLFKEWVKGKEPMLVLVLSYLIGISAKIAGLYGGNELKHWLAHLVCLLVFVALPSFAIHDNIINKLLRRKAEPPK